MFILSTIHLALPIVAIFCNLFKEIIELGLEKHWDYLNELVLTLWYIGFGLEKYSDYLTGFGLTLSLYDILVFGLKTFSTRTTSLDLDWFY